MKIKTFRFTITDYDEMEVETIKNSGFVTARNYGEAVTQLESIYTSPKTKESSIIDISIYEIDAFDKGILFDTDIDQIQQVEENETE